jgi:hypothetical protein
VPRPPATAAPELTVAADPADPDPGALVWVGIGGVGLMLAAAVVVVRTLRR